jgi:hypothetical protein
VHVVAEHALEHLITLLPVLVGLEVEQLAAEMPGDRLARPAHSEHCLLQLILRHCLLSLLTRRVRLLEGSAADEGGGSGRGRGEAGSTETLLGLRDLDHRRCLFLSPSFAVRVE